MKTDQLSVKSQWSIDHPSGAVDSGRQCVNKSLLGLVIRYAGLTLYTPAVNITIAVFKHGEITSDGIHFDVPG